MSKSLLLACAAMLMGGVSTAFAQSNEKAWTNGSEVGEGNFIIYNVGTKGYLDGGFGTWGTNGGIYKNPRFFNFAKKDDGSYKIDTQINNGGEAHYVQASTWLDGAAVGQTFQIVNSAIPTYTFGNGGNVFGATAKGQEWTLDAAGSSQNTEWMLISEDDYKAKLKELEYDGETYFNATALIKGARVFRNFTNGIDKDGNWTITFNGETKNLNGGNNQYRAAEFFNSTFSMEQTIADVPNGKYVFSVQGFQRISNNTKPTVIFANEAQSPLMLRSEGNATEANFMDAAGEAFFNGDFSNNSVTVVVTDHQLKLGLRKDTKVGTDDWVIFNNFSLYYYGLDLSELKATFSQRITEAENVGLCDAEVKAELATSLAEAKAVASSNDEDVLNQTLTKLNASLEKAKASVAAYVQAKADMDKLAANVATLDTYAQKAYTDHELTKALDQAYSNGTLNLETYRDDLHTILYAAVKAQNTYPADVTALLSSPSFEDGQGNWQWNNATDTGIKDNSNKTYNIANADGLYVFNTWNTDTNEKYVRQTVTLPEGTYEMSALVASDANNQIKLFAGDNEVTVVTTVKEEGVRDTVGIVARHDGVQVVLGAKSNSWYKVDDFRLILVGTAFDGLKGELAEYTDQVKALDKTLVSNAMGDRIDNALYLSGAAKDVAKLEEAIDSLIAVKKAYNEMLQPYAAANDLIDVCQNILANSTPSNDQVASALTAAIATAQTDVQAAANAQGVDDVAAALELARQAYVLKAYPVAGKCSFDMTFVEPNLSATVGGSGQVPAGWTSDASDFKINTWSTEGNTDGSNFKVPFVESWVASDEIGGHTSSLLLSNLPKGQYTVSGLIRVATKENVTYNGKVYLCVGDDKVELNSDCKKHEAGLRKLYNPSLGALVKDGTLAIAVEVEDNATYWVSFKDFKLQLNRALTDEEDFIAPEELILNVANNTIGAEGIELQLATPTSGADLSAYWSSSDENIATVSPTGVVTPVNNGKVIITAKSVHNELASASVTLYVQQREAIMPEQIQADGDDYRITGQNLIKNGGFEYANPFLGWTAGDGKPMTMGNFVTGFRVEENDKQTLVATDSKGDKDARSISTAWPIEPGKTYAIGYQYADCGSGFQKVSLTNEPGVETLVISQKFNDLATEPENMLKGQDYAFTNTEGYKYVQVRFRWLGNGAVFDNFYLAEAEPILADLNELTAVVDGVKGNVLGFSQGQYATYNNDAAAKALAAAQAILAKPAPNCTSQGIVNETVNAIYGTPWTVNDTDVNAIYDGTFGEYAYKENGDNEQPIGWTGDNSHNNAANVRHMYGETANAGLLATSSREAMMMKFGASYGKVDGYTMPLEANAVYALTFKYGGWNEKGTKKLTVTAPDGTTIELDPAEVTAPDNNAHTTAGSWAEYKGVFTTTEAGNYVLNFVHKGNSTSQNQLVVGDMKLIIDREATAVGSAKAATALDGTIYDLAGRRVSRAQKGLYIINGKKVVK